MNERYLCKIASPEEFKRKWDYEIAVNAGDANWPVWRGNAQKNFDAGYSLPYYGILDDEIICEATAIIHPAALQMDGIMTDDGTVYLYAFRTVEAYRGKGYFSALMRYMQNDLKRRGYTRAVLGVEPKEAHNHAIYQHWGFNGYLFTTAETYPDGTVVEVAYYTKEL